MHCIARLPCRGGGTASGESTGPGRAETVSSEILRVVATSADASLCLSSSNEYTYVLLNSLPTGRPKRLPRPNHNLHRLPPIIHSPLPNLIPPPPRRLDLP